MGKKTILLIDDDVDDQLIFTEAVKEIAEGVECITAKSGLDGLIKLKEIEPLPALVFIDLNMPLLNGFECLQKIRGDPRMHQIPVIIFTTSDNPRDKERTLNLGAEKFLTKTADFKQLKDQLQSILETDFSVLK